MTKPFSKPRVCLVIIDAQVSFCDPKGSLAVPGADDDCRRAAAWIRKNKDQIDSITATFDTHPNHAIFFPEWHVGRNGETPAPFTTITYKDYMDGVWTTRDPSHRDATLFTLRGLEKRGRFNCTIWPRHCIIGSPGFNLFPDIFDATTEWEIDRGKFMRRVTKGTDPRTEHYSPFGAEVPYDDNPDTHLNLDLIQRFNDYDKVVIIGEARSHCVANGVRDLLDNLGDASKLVLFEDCMSNVPGFESLGESFFEDAIAKGATITTSTAYSI